MKKLMLTLSVDEKSSENCFRLDRQLIEFSPFSSPRAWLPPIDARRSWRETNRYRNLPYSIVTNHRTPTFRIFHQPSFGYEDSSIAPIGSQIANRYRSNRYSVLIQSVLDATVIEVIYSAPVGNRSPINTVPTSYRTRLLLHCLCRKSV